MEELTCIFTNCTSNNEEIKKLSDTRLLSIAQASKEREDNFNSDVVQKLKNDGVTLASHRSCVSTYTSKNHIARYIAQKQKNENPKEPERKRLRRSNEHLFNFRENCFFCGNACLEKDPKNPNRWKPYFLVRTVYMKNFEPFKEFILKICDIRSDTWSVDVKFRVNSALSDLHAADARYHQECKTLFLHSKYVDLAAQSSDEIMVDSALDYVKCTIKSKQQEKEMWNSVEIYNMYSENGGHLLSRRSLISKLVDYFGNETVLLSSPGVASILVFKKFCHFSLHNIDDNENKNLKEIASTIEKETQRTERTKYKVEFDVDSLTEGFSGTLMDLLSELKIGKLPALMIGSIITSSLTKQRTDLQVAIANHIKRKIHIEELHKFLVSCSYDEFQLFKGSAAYAATEMGKECCVSKTGNAKLIQGISDNFDCSIASPNGLKQTHSMAIIMTQEHLSLAKESDQVTHIRRKSKKELQSIPVIEPPISRYKGPSNPSMPAKEAVYNALPLRVLATAAISVNRANDHDFHFMSLIANDVEVPEYSGFNTKITRESGQQLRPATHTTYYPLINMNPAEPDTVLTTMHIVKSATEKAGQEYTVFTNDQQLYKIATQMTWWQPDVWTDFYPVLGGMHMLMSFIGCIGTLMANTGLVEILKSAFGGVDKMLLGKKYPNNLRALRMCTEEVLRDVLLDDSINDFETLMNSLRVKANQSRTARLWLDGLIWPVFIAMRFVRASREADWPLHISTVRLMLPYFAAAGHWHYLRYSIVYLMKMTKLPENLLNKFLAGEHAMRHQNGLWNSIWSDQMIETTVMRYGHGPSGMVGITFNDKALDQWARSLHISTRVEKNLLGLNDNLMNKDVTQHKEESMSRIKSDSMDRENIRKFLATCLHPLLIDEFPNDIINIHSCKLSTKPVNVDNCVSIGTEQVQQFIATLPSGFYETLSKKVTTMSVLKKSIKVNDVDVIDTSLIYSRVLALQLTHDAMRIENVLKFELAPIPTSIFGENGLLRPAKTKSELKRIGTTVSSRSSQQPDFTVIDGCAIFYVVNWPTKALVKDFVENMCSYVLARLKTNDTAVVFDRYHDFSIKSSTRLDRGSGSSRTHMLALTSPLPAKQVTFGSSHNKIQLIKLICENLVAMAISMEESHSLLVTGSDPSPIEVKNGLVVNRHDLQTTHEEADLILVQQAYRSALDLGIRTISVICDDTDVFVLLVYFYWKLNLSSTILLQSTGADRTLIDIGNTVVDNIDIVPNLVAAHALSGCDTAAPYHGIGKLTVVKKLREGILLNTVGDISADMATAIEQVTHFISDCYGYPSTSMTDCRIQSWYQKTSKARKTAPQLKTLPPTHEAFTENVKRGILQVIIWYSTMEPDPPNVDVTLYGWIKDMVNRILVPVGLPENIPAAPEQILNMIKCGCPSASPCKTKQCSCSSASAACSIICKCKGDPDVCQNKETKRLALAKALMEEEEGNDEDGDKET